MTCPNEGEAHSWWFVARAETLRPHLHFGDAAGAFLGSWKQFSGDIL